MSIIDKSGASVSEQSGAERRGKINREEKSRAELSRENKHTREERYAPTMELALDAALWPSSITLDAKARFTRAFSVCTSSIAPETAR
jgi:hypothetical protein